MRLESVGKGKLVQLCTSRILRRSIHDKQDGNKMNLIGITWGASVRSGGKSL